MRSPNNWGSRVPSDHFLSSNETSKTKSAFYSIELLAKEAPRQSPDKPSCCKENRFLSEN